MLTAFRTKGFTSFLSCQASECLGILKICRLLLVFSINKYGNGAIVYESNLHMRSRIDRLQVCLQVSSELTG